MSKDNLLHPTRPADLSGSRAAAVREAAATLKRAIVENTSGPVPADGTVITDEEQAAVLTLVDQATDAALKLLASE